MSDAPEPWVIRENVISVADAYGDPDITPLDWAEKAYEVLMQVRSADLARPRVKPLEWRLGDECFKAYSPFGLYEVSDGGGGIAVVRHNGSIIARVRWAADRAERNAAQADFERRVMECLL